MIQLFQPPTAFGLPNLSPFCAKTETYLRMAGLEYETRVGLPPRGPKKKVPWIVDGDDKISDSTAIIDHLQKRYPNALDSALTPQDHALGRAIQTMLEEHLYFVVLSQRWMTPDGWRITQPAAFEAVPRPLRGPISRIFRRQIRRNLWGQGIGRHDREMVENLGIRDIDALATLLGDQPYILGGLPSSYDASVFGFLVNVVDFPLATRMRAATLAHDNLVDYVARIKSQYFPELVASEPEIAPTKTATSSS